MSKSWLPHKELQEGYDLSLNNVGDLVVSLDVDSVKFSQQMAQARRQLCKFGQDAESTSHYLDGLKRSAMGVTSVLAGSFTLGSLIQQSDEWGQLSSRMAMATQSADELAHVQQRLMEISDRTYKPVSEQSELYIRSASAMREYGYSTAETVDFIDSVSSALTINAVSAQRAESAINALSKATVAGKVSGQNWQTILETIPTIASDIARHMGVTETAVRQLAQSGQLSFQAFSDAIIAAREENARLAEEMPTTVGDAVTKLSNHWKAYIGEANAAGGATATLAAGISTLAEHLDLLVVVGQSLALGIGAKYLLTMANNARQASVALIQNRASQLALAESQLKAAQAAQYKTTLERRAAEAARYAAVNTEKQRLATLALVQARHKEAAAINAVAVAQTRLNSVSSLASRAGTSLLNVMGGLPGIIALGGAAMYGLYQHQENARKSAREYGETINQIAAKIEEMRLPETWDNENKSRNALGEQNRLIAEQDNRVRKLNLEIQGLQQMIANPGPMVGGYMVNHLMSLESAKAKLAQSTAQLSVEQARLTELQEKSGAIQKVIADLEQHRIRQIREEAAEQNRQYQSQLLMNGAYASFNSVLSAGNTLLQARSTIRAPFILPQNDLTDAQQNTLKAAGRNRELAGLQGADRARRQAEFAADDIGLTGPENARARQQLIDDTVAATELQSELKQTVQNTADPYADIVRNQQRQLALYGETTEQARIQYEITQGELRGLSDQQKITLQRNAAELDRLATQARFKSLTDQLQTQEEKSLATARERLQLLNEANVSAEVYADTLSRISKDMVTDAPQFAGIDASIGGAAGELFKIADAEQALNEWHAKQLTLLEAFFADKEGMEEEHAARVAEINQQLAKQQQQIQYASSRTMLTIYGDFTNGAVELLSAMGQESSAVYKAMFLASKTAAFANALVSTHEAAAKALTLGPIAGIPAEKMILGLGYANAAMIASTALAGMAHDGIDYIPQEGTWLLQKGERVLDSRTNADLKNYLAHPRSDVAGNSESAGIVIHQMIEVNGNGDEALIAAMEEAAERGALSGAELARQEMINDFMSNGQARRVLNV